MNTRPNGYIWMAAEQFFNAAEHIWNDEKIELNRYVHPIAYFGVSRPVISASSGHLFRCDPASRFGIIRPPVSV